MCRALAGLSVLHTSTHFITMKGVEFFVLFCERWAHFNEHLVAQGFAQVETHLLLSR